MCSLKALQDWCRDVCEGYSDVIITDMSSSFKDGMAFCAIIHKHRPDLLDFHSLSKHNVCENMRLAFDVAERELGIPTLLDPDELVSVEEPDLLSIITYVAQLHYVFRGNSHVSQKIPVNNESSSTKTQEQKHTQAFDVAERELGIPTLLDPDELVSVEEPDLLSIITYVAQLHYVFRGNSHVDSETGSLQCSYPCKPAPEHDQPADQHSQMNTSEMDGDRSETDGDKINYGCLSTSSETYKNLPNLLPERGRGLRNLLAPPPDHRIIALTMKTKAFRAPSVSNIPWMKLVDPGPWYRLPPAPAPSTHSRHQPMTFNPFLDENNSKLKRY
ncbi:hypothetical protein Q8A67_001382 [Cirrhinus molitorella]|uniref:Calponin-homology (CH) domain-containing protein n=1 Tax=Cirrhinus molitorella TaxID=172907 RepID=A0AA88Q720_9TELE|nr:hypothetical protein Q8A67_001382 [Cirrhinus molitorella]